MKRVYLFLALGAVLIQGCAATQLAGQAVRNAIKDIDVTVTKGYDIKDLANSKIAISTNVGNEQNANVAMLAMLTGRKVSGDSPAQATVNVYTDMLMKEFLKKGFDARSISDTFNAADPNNLKVYKDQGYKVVIKGNLKLETSTSAWGSITGGDVTYSGIKEFSLKGIDTDNGRVVFIVTGSYGAPKEAETVAEDIAKALSERMN